MNTLFLIIKSALLFAAVFTTIITIIDNFHNKKSDNNLVIDSFCPSIFWAVFYLSSHYF